MLEIFLIIEEKDPKEIQDRIKEPEIKMLILVQPIPLLASVIRIHGWMSISSSTPSTLV
jgi:hypothetical protein